MTPTPRTDAILSLLPGGQSCDPQLLADELRPMIAELERELTETIKLRGFIEQAAVKLEEDKEFNARLCDTLREELEKERALADRLAGVLLSYDHDLLAGEDMQWLPEHDEALTAWKEARSGTV